MLSSRPYLLRAMYEWIVDCGMTPHILADASNPEARVPPSAIQDGKVVLNIGPSAVRDLLIDGEGVSFVARFAGVSQAVSVPTVSVLAVYARENGRGMMFGGDDAEDQEHAAAEEGDDDDPGPPGKRASRPNLRVVK